jgi:hypothetical protein
LFGGQFANAAQHLSNFTFAANVFAVPNIQGIAGGKLFQLGLGAFGYGFKLV